MQKQDIKEALIDFGLSEYEAMVYLASLSLGPATVNQIAKKSSVKRTTVYPVIEGLKRKGIMNIEIRGLKKSYVAEKPERLKVIIERKREKMEGLIPELMAIQKLKENESIIKYYEGVEGVKTVYDSILNDLHPRDEYLIISNAERLFGIDEKYFSDFIKKRAKLNLQIKIIAQNTSDAWYYKKSEQGSNHKIRILEEGIDFTANLAILPKKLIITQIVDPIVCIVIENKSIVEMQRQQFNIIWNSIK